MDRVVRIVRFGAAAIFVVVLASCLSFDEARCADGRICPVAHRCGDGGTCIPLTCGDGEINGTEQCEPGAPDDLGGMTCLDFGSKTPDGLICTQQCKFDRSACSACGDGVMGEGEQCDGDDFGPNGIVDCRDPRAGFYDAGTVRCSPICTWDVSSCTGFCGDGIQNGPELCDGGAPAGESCLDHGFDGGRLSCAQCGRSFAGCSALGWQRVASPSGEHLQSIWGTSASNVFFVGDGGTILRWNGSSFQVLTSPVSNALAGVWGSAADDVFFVGGDTSGVILHYDGNSVTPMPLPNLPNCPVLRSVWGTGPNDVYAAGDGGMLAHYNGSTWSPVTDVTSMTTSSLRSIWGTGPTNIHVVGAAGTVIHYDGAWTFLGDPLDSPTSGANQADLAAVWGSASNDVFAVSRRREVFHFDGITWTQSPVATPPVGTLLADVAIVGGTADDVFVVGIDPATPATPVMLHFDGTRWTKLVPPFDYEALRAIWRAPNGEIWAAGEDGYVLRWGGSGWTTTASGLATALRSVATLGPSDAFAVGDGGIIRRYDGATWAAQSSGTSARLNAVWTSPPSFASAVGDAGTFRHYPGTGTTWPTPTSTAPATDLFAVWGTATNNIYAGGLAGAVRRFDGTSWSAEPTTPPATVDVAGLWGTASTNIFAASRTKVLPLEGAIHRFDGSSWIPTPMALATQYVQGLWGTGTNDVFAVGDAVFHFDGASWRRMTANGRRLHAVSGTGARDVFAVGDGGTLLHYDGIDWRPIRVLAPGGSPVTTHLRGIAATSRSVIVVGDGGFVQRLSFSKRPMEVNCRDAWDDDGDGLPDCADPECNDDPYCDGGGTCTIAQQALACGSTITSTTVGRTSSRDYYTCSPNAETGPDVIYRFESAMSSPATVTLSNFGSADLDVVVLGSMPTNRACDPDFACEGAGATTDAVETVSFTATAGRAYYVVVDGHGGAAAPFTLSVTCP